MIFTTSKAGALARALLALGLLAAGPASAQSFSTGGDLGERFEGFSKMDLGGAISLGGYAGDPILSNKGPIVLEQVGAIEAKAVEEVDEGAAQLLARLRGETGYAIGGIFISQGIGSPKVEYPSYEDKELYSCLAAAQTEAQKQACAKDSANERTVIQQLE